MIHRQPGVNSGLAGPLDGPANRPTPESGGPLPRQGNSLHADLQEWGFQHPPEKAFLTPISRLFVGKHQVFSLFSQSLVSSL